MKVYNNVLELVGNTPLVRLNRLANAEMATVYAKLENLNPAGSVKERMAIHIVERAEREGLIKPGGTLVESTSGNTGLGLALAAAVKGYRLIVTIPDKMSQEKIDMLKGYGAEVIVTPTNVPHDAPESYVEVAKKIARETPNSYYTDQYNNPANPEVHYLTTGPEIWADTDGKIDVLVGGLGTGGTISGAAKYLKEQAAKVGRSVRVVCPDPEGSIYADAFYKREIREPKQYKVEGIGHDWMVGTLDLNVIDEIRNISDRDSFLVARKLAREEGIFSGGSTGTAVCGALQVAREIGPGKIVVVIVCDSGDRYISKVYNDAWMKDLGFLDASERLGTIRELVNMKGRNVEFANPEESIASVAQRMSDLGISQMPIMENDRKSSLMIHEIDILQGLVQNKCKSSDPALKVATYLQGKVGLDDSVQRLQEVFEQQNVAIVVDRGSVVSIVSKIDLVKFLTSRG
ncbi:MAG: pyridoxal-phosphate dependent enzyme [Deltaproteobacteria bacterium]|nr:pyridoxal-phosphate dependent enzyme [Deltaproteobacteria bacterium]